MKRRLIIVLSLAVTLLTLVSVSSCKLKDGTDYGGEQSVVNENCIYSKGTSLSLVFNLENVSKEHIIELRDAIDYARGVITAISNDAKPVAMHEIVVGRSERAISKEAYRLLNRHEYETDTTVGFLIYSDGKSVAIAYDDTMLGIDFAEKFAIEWFIENYLKSDELVLKKGYAYSDYVDVIEYQQSLDEIYIAKAWEQIETALLEKTNKENAEAVLEALKKYRSVIINTDMVEWMANLYEPTIGGFYYSNSARNTEGYLPDIESTAFALSIITDSGMLVSSETGKAYELVDVISPEMRNQIVSWVKGLQDSRDGYFYHPQWSRQLINNNLTRRGRDLDMAVMILRMMGSHPTYLTPSGVPGDGILPNGTQVAPTKLLVSPLIQNGSKASAVSKVLLANNEDANVDAHLINDEAFYQYIDKNYNAMDPYSFGSLLEAQGSAVFARDQVLKSRGETYSLCQIFLDYMTEKQDPETALWGRSNHNMLTKINGVLKITSAIDKMGKVIPNAEKVFMACLAFGTEDSYTPTSVCDVFNPFYACTKIISNIETYGSKELKASIEKCRAAAMDRAVLAIRQTQKNIAMFLRPDGSFGYLKESSAHYSEGMPVAVKGSYEGDFNATGISFNSAINVITATLGIPLVPKFHFGDFLRFRHIIDNLREAIKDEFEATGPITFEDYDADDVPNGITLTDKSLALKSEIKKDGPTGNYLSFLSAGKQDQFTISSFTDISSPYNAVAFETDMSLSTVNGNEAVTYFWFPSQDYMLVNNGKVVIGTSKGIQINTDVLDGEWFKLKLEYFVDDIQKIAGKNFFVNEKLEYTEMFDYSTAKSVAEVSEMSFFTATNGGGAHILLDNVELKRCNGTIPVIIPTPDLPIMKELPENGVYTFETLPDGWLPYGMTMTSASGKTVISTGNDSAHGDYLSLESHGRDLLSITKFTKEAEKYNALALEMDINQTLLADVAVLFINVGDKQTSLYFRDGYIIIQNDYENYVSFETYVSESEWFNLRIEYYYDTSDGKCGTIYKVNGNAIANVAHNLTASTNIYGYASPATLAGQSTAGDFLLLIDNLIYEKCAVDKNVEIIKPTKPETPPATPDNPPVTPPVTPPIEPEEEEVPKNPENPELSEPNYPLNPDNDDEDGWTQTGSK